MKYMIEAPGPHYLAARTIGGLTDFYWSRDDLKPFERDCVTCDDGADLDPGGACGACGRVAPSALTGFRKGDRFARPEKRGTCRMPGCPHDAVGDGERYCASCSAEIPF